MNPFRRTCRTVASWLLAITLPFACTLASAQAEVTVISAPVSALTLAGLRGSASPARAIPVTGSNLNAEILATAPAGFEVSSDNTTFGATAALQPVAGGVSGTFHVRIASSSTVPLGDLTGNLTLSSNLATPVTVGLAGFVEAGLPAFGTVQTFAGTGTAGSTDGNSTTARFNGPWGISADPHGNLYPIDYSGKRIRKVTPGAVASFLDSFSSFPPQYSAVDPATGDLYVSVESHRILRYANKNGAKYPAEAPVYGPDTDFADSVIVYAGASTSGTTDSTGTAARFNNPRGLAVHAGYLYVADRGNNAIRKINLSNAAVTTVSITTGSLSAPEGVCVDAAGVIYLTSTVRDGVEKITTDGVRHSVAGAAVGGFVDGDAATAKFNDPHGITLDVRGNLIVADAGNHAIRRVTPAGDVVTIAGGSATGSYVDGLGSVARFNSPRGIVFGPDGWLYVTDFNNHRIRRVNATKPQVVLTPATLALFTTDFASPSASRTVEVVGSASAGLITVTAPAGFEVSTDGTTYSSSVQVNSTASLRVRIAATTPTGAVSGDLSIVSENAGTQTLALSGFVNLLFTLSREQISGIQTDPGLASAAETVTLDGDGFTGPLNITAPQGFEISTDGTNFSPSVRLGDYPSSIQTVYRGEFGRSTNASAGHVWGSGSGSEFPARRAFAAITSDRSVVTWGDGISGGNSSSVAEKLSSDVAKVFSTAAAFAAVKSDGSVVTWGSGSYGGDSSSVGGELVRGVTRVSSTYGAFAALKSDGSVVTWGAGDNGGDSSSVAGLDSNVVSVFSNSYAFAALKSDGSVIKWGNGVFGGDSSAVAGLGSGVTGVFSTNGAFAALKSDGSVIAWGNGNDGGDSSAVVGLSGVTAIFSNNQAFAALKSNGSVVTWGSPAYGGDSSSVAVELGWGVTGVSSTSGAFAALKSDGSVVTWGESAAGGDSSSVAGLGSEITAVYSNDRAFAALKSDGSVITWGHSNRGGDSSSVTGLTSGVTGIYSTQRAFAALKADGSVVTWGDRDYGGKSASVAGSLASEVTAISSTGNAFAALKADGSVVTWGNPSFGGSGGPGNIGTPVTILPSFPVTLHVRIASNTPQGPVSGNLTFETENADNRTLALSGLVRRIPIIVRAPEVVYTGNTSVRLDGTVNPNGFETTVQFEYGTTTSYGTTVPVTQPSANGTTAGAVGLSLADLATGFYHYRITATNAEGTRSSSDGVFSIYLPTDGTPDAAYQSAHGSKLTGPSANVYDSAVDDNGRWFGVGASFTAYGTTAAKGLVCLKPDGTPDAEFHTNLGSGLSHSSYLSLESVLIRRNGKILVSGQFNRLNGVEIRSSIASINPDGTPDTAFNVRLNSLNAQFGYSDLVEQADGKILGGLIDKVVRLNADGTRDTGFSSPSLGSISAVAVQPDGKILAASSFGGLKRLHADGSADSAFNTALGTNFNRDAGNMSVTVIRVAPDGGIWVGGHFTTFDSQSVPGLVRLNSDGTLDGSALAAMGPAFAGNGPLTILDIHLQRDGRIIVCGGGMSRFSNSWSSAGLRRLNADGSPDTPFSTRLGSGFSGTPMTLAVRPTGELIVGGIFSSVSRQPAKGIAQLAWASDGRLTPETQSVSATYGSAMEETSAFTTSGLSGTVSYSIRPALPSGLSLNSATGVVSGKPGTVLSAATTYTLTATGSTAGTAAATLTLSVAKAPLTVTANDATRSRGQSNPSFGVTFTGLVNGDTLSAISGAASYSCEATTGSSPGSYAITPSLGTLAAANYRFQSFVAGSLTVGKAAQTLNIAPLATSVPLKDLGNVSLAATSSAGLPVTLTLEAGSAATLAGSIGTYSLSDIGQTGTVTVRASQAGDEDHEAAQDVLVSFDVTKSNQAITFDAPADKTFGDAPFNLSATADSGLAVAFSVISGPAQLDGSSITLTGAGTVVVRASQAGNGLFNEAGATRGFNVDRAAQTITFGTLAAVTYGDAPVTLAATSVSGLAVTYDIVSGSAALVGGTVAHDAASTVVVRASQAGDDKRLAAVPVERTLIVNRKALTVTGATAADKVVDESTAARIFGAELAGGVDGDEVFLFHAEEGTFPQAAPGSNLAVATAMTVDGPDAGNYTLVQPSLTASITELDAPSAPTSLVATAGDGQVSIAFTAGAEGGSAVTNYEFSTDDGTNWTAFSPAVTTSPAVMTGLTNGTPYSIRLRAVTADGNGTASGAVSATPVDPPIVFRAAAKASATTSVSVSKMTSKAGGVLGTTVSVSSVAATSEQGATVALAGSAIQYTPALGFSGVDRFRVTFTSSAGAIVGLIEMTTAATSGGSGSSHLANPARLTPLSGGRMGIQFNGIPGVAYQVQRSTDLNTWTTIATITAGPRGAIDFTDDSPPAPSGFYRLATP